MAVVSEAVRAQVVAQADGVCEYCRYPEEAGFGDRAKVTRLIVLL